LKTIIHCRRLLVLGRFDGRERAARPPLPLDSKQRKRV